MNYITIHFPFTLIHLTEITYAFLGGLTAGRYFANMPPGFFRGRITNAFRRKMKDLWPVGDDEIGDFSDKYHQHEGEKLGE